ncbi:two component regulator propeller domain-containing protein [Candidatus Magnetobacterium bavaricum]|uniref:Two component regulator propeller domain-containing protein n=1 Tax=Candidatus Magnetobacterium bavaricum TaxID=29290 RepID=A0A0F3GKS2_9BACT|nr:two component regulator propeller domain-containing protein [Candidatus Magnetobacterium bavaricum]
MFDHGGVGRFRMRESETLYAASLKNWINTMQDKISGTVVVIYDACESGSFLYYLTPPEGKKRIVITSTKYGEEAYSLYNGIISFSEYFWGQINAGGKLYNAFTSDSDGISYSFTNQTPQLDDDGNGIYETKIDGEIAKTYTIGKGIVTGSVIPFVGSVSEPQTLNGTTSTLLWAKEITGNGNLKKVWAVIRPPDFRTGSTSDPVTSMPDIELTYNKNNNRYEATYNRFTEKGTYNIGIFAMDDKSNVSLPKTTTVEQTVLISTNPVAEITANGIRNELYVYTKDTINIDIKFTAGNRIGTDAQWWLYAYTNFGTYYFDLASGWSRGYTATHQGALTDLPSTRVFTTQGWQLPAGNYLFVFEVKTTDGESYRDSVAVNVFNK